MTAFSCAWVDLFRKGKWKDCADAIRLELKDLSAQTNRKDIPVLRIILENNLFVCDQLTTHWESLTEDCISSKWSTSFNVIYQTHRLMRCQNVCSDIPVDVVLCVTSNFLWWTAMKVDPLHQHCCQNESVTAALFSFKTVGKLLGVWNEEYLSTGWEETDFLKALKTVISCLIKLTPVQCQLAIEIIILMCLIILDDTRGQSKNCLDELMGAMDQLVELIPLLKVHFSQGRTDKFNKCGVLLKFGWQNSIGQILNTSSILTISETLLLCSANLSLRMRLGTSNEGSERALKYLNRMDGEASTSFLHHYMLAIVNFHSGNLTASSFHLEHASMCKSNFFMQGRCKILKAQILLLQNNPAEALEVLESVQYKRKDVQIPLCAFLIGKAYGMLGEAKQQAEVLDLLSQCLLAEPSVQPRLISPLVEIDHRLLLSVHVQPEISYAEVLKASGSAHLAAQQPKAAADKILELLHVTTADLDDMSDSNSLWELSELLHDAASALLEANFLLDAQEVCEAALQFHTSRLEPDLCRRTGLSSLPEDVIALLLLAEVKESDGSSDTSDILNRCGSLLQTLQEKVLQTDDENEKTIDLCKALLARVFLRKALINVRKKFEEDAVACFQRALHWKTDDTEVVLRFALHLLEESQIEESLALWQLYKDIEKAPPKHDNFTLNRLLGERMCLDDKEALICRLSALSSQ